MNMGNWVDDVFARERRKRLNRDIKGKRIGEGKPQNMVGVKLTDQYPGKKGKGHEVGRKRKGWWQTFKTVHDTHGENTATKHVYGMKGEDEVFYKDKISMKNLNTKLAPYGAVKNIEGDFKFIPIPSEAETIEIKGDADFSGKDFVTKAGAYEIAKNISLGVKNGAYGFVPAKVRSHAKTPDEFYEFLTGEKLTNSAKGNPLEKRIGTTGLFFFSLSGIFFAINKLSATGFVINNLINWKINFGILLSVLGLIFSVVLMRR